MLSNKWVQWILISLVITLIQRVVSGLMDISWFPTSNLTALIKTKKWAEAIYFIMNDAGTIISGAYLLRACGFIEFVKL